VTLIEAIREKTASGAFEFSEHAVDQSILRQIAVHEVAEAIAGGEVIEDYPHDKYGPSCLILGFANSGRPIHVQCSYPSGPRVKVITTYEPDSEHWIDYRNRRN
jgi:Domain of unknown function (DUF4258)